jgi:hypothetical protein
MTVFEKDPEAVLDYTVDWTDRLEGIDTIATSIWIVPAGITNDIDTFTATSATIWLSGGTINQTYRLINEIVTVGGRIQDRTIAILMRQG